MSFSFFLRDFYSPYYGKEMQNCYHPADYVGVEDEANCERTVGNGL